MLQEMTINEMQDVNGGGAGEILLGVAIGVTANIVYDGIKTVVNSMKNPPPPTPAQQACKSSGGTMSGGKGCIPAKYKSN
jgi:hypothetical protein